MEPKIWHLMRLFRCYGRGMNLLLRRLSVNIDKFRCYYETDQLIRNCWKIPIYWRNFNSYIVKYRLTHPKVKILRTEQIYKPNRFILTSISCKQYFLLCGVFFPLFFYSFQIMIIILFASFFDMVTIDVVAVQCLLGIRAVSEWERERGAETAITKTVSMNSGFSI